MLNIFLIQNKSLTSEWMVHLRFQIAVMRLYSDIFRMFLLYDL